jgi:hypothetical protein
MDDDKLYGKILDVLLVLRDTAEKFRGYSASDIKKLIAAKREPTDLRILYLLADMIDEVRARFELSRTPASEILASIVKY